MNNHHSINNNKYRTKKKRKEIKNPRPTTYCTAPSELTTQHKFITTVNAFTKIELIDNTSFYSIHTLAS